MRIRNFELEIKADGRKNILQCGPRPANGGFSMAVSCRDSGNSSRVLTIIGNCSPLGHLSLTVHDEEGMLLYEHHSER